MKDIILFIVTILTLVNFVVASFLIMVLRKIVITIEAMREGNIPKVDLLVAEIKDSSLFGSKE